MRLLSAVVLAVAALACGGAVAAGPSPESVAPGVAGAAQAVGDGPPPRMEGLWQLTTTLPREGQGPGPPPFVMSMCLPGVLDLWAQTPGAPRPRAGPRGAADPDPCVTSTRRDADGQVVTEHVCRAAGAGSGSVRVVFTWLSASHVHIQTDTKLAEGAQDADPATDVIDQDAVYQGACPSTMKPGQVMTGGGRVVGDLLSFMLVGEAEQKAQHNAAAAQWAGRRPVWSAACRDGGALELVAEAWPSPIGDATGWGLLFHDDGSGSIALYDDGLRPAGDPEVWTTSAPYSAWGFEGQSYSAPGPAYLYAPMPDGPADDVTVFDPAAGLVANEGGRGDPPFMNIFIDPATLSRPDFSVIRACLADQRQALNAALKDLPNHLPWPAATRLRVLALGGVAYERPPYTDPAYLEALARMRATTTIPPFGPFLLYPGGEATGQINGHAVRVLATPAGDYPSRIEVDGRPVVARPDGTTNMRGLRLNGWSWDFDGPVCTSQNLTRCAKNLEFDNAIDDPAVRRDTSERFNVVLRIGENAYAASPAWALAPAN